MLNHVEAFSAAQSAKDVAAILVTAGAEYDVAFASHRILNADGTSQGVTTMPVSWVEHYRASGYDKLDPGAGRAATLLGAGGDSFEAPAFGEDWCAKERQMNWEIRQLKANGSFFVSQATPKPGVTSMISFITDASGAQYGQWIVSHGRHLRMLATTAHVRLMELSGIAVANSPLTARERDVLRWLAEGHRVDRIAEKMGLSNRTIEAHLASARQRLGAKTREQALVLAVRMGLLDQTH